jgi:hypothetical protein
VCIWEFYYICHAMKNTKQNSTIWKQRITLMLALLFCMLVSGAEFVAIQNDQQQQTVKSVEKPVADKDDATNPQESFVDIAVDAVVPFGTVLSQQVFHLIYETFTFPRPLLKGPSLSFPLSSPYFSILFERIISTNAP